MFPTDFAQLRRAAALLDRAFDAGCFENAVEYAQNRLNEHRKRETDACWGYGLRGHPEFVVPALTRLSGENPDECRLACIANSNGTKLTVLCEALSEYLDNIDAPHPAPTGTFAPTMRKLGEPHPAAVTAQTIERKLARERKRRDGE